MKFTRSPSLQALLKMTDYGYKVWTTKILSDSDM